ncbi:Sulfite exporter TauE/SafE family protein 4 [Picochlorum sp. SENEW3]|nr:Sulfite exporter TauE/SafE family protein 4 [Picochlorum sp. SENEW3]
MVAKYTTPLQRQFLLLVLVACAAAVGVGLGSISDRMRYYENGERVYRVARRLLEQLVDSQTPLTMTWRTGLAIPLYLIMAALATSAGIGGGLFWVPLFTALMQFTVKSAAALSQSCVAGGCLGGTVYSITQRNPLTDSRPMIDYSLTLVLMPALVLGMSIGVMLNYIIPSLIISCILLVILLVISFRTFQQGVRMVRAERKHKKSLEVVPDDVQPGSSEPGRASPIYTDGTESLEAGTCGSTSDSPVTTIREGGSKDEKNNLQEKLSALQYGDTEQEETDVKKKKSLHKKVLTATTRKLKRSATKVIGHIGKPLIPWKHFIEILSIAGAFLALEIGKSFFSKCAWQVWTMLGVQVALMACCSAFFIWFHDHPVPIKHSHVHHGGVQDEDDEEDEDWKPSKLALIWLLMLVLGVISGTVGLGGGVMISPLLLELHVHPQTAAATSTFITLFASTTATVAFGLDDRLNLQYMALYAPLCLVGGFLGVFILTGLIKKYKMTAIVSLMVGVLVLVSAGLVVGFALRESIEDITNGDPLHVDDLCTES